MSIKAINLPSITNLKIGADLDSKYLYIKNGTDEYSLLAAPNIQYVSEFPTSGLVENSIYVDSNGQSKLWTNSTTGWVSLSVELMHELNSSLTSSQIVDGKTIYDELQKGIKLVEVNEIPVTGDNNTFYITSGGQAAAKVTGDVINLSYEITDIISAASMEQVPTNYAVSSFVKSNRSIAYVGSTFPVSGINNTIYIDENGQSKAYVNDTWQDISVEVIHSLNANATSAQILDAKELYTILTGKADISDLPEAPSTVVFVDSWPQTYQNNKIYVKIDPSPNYYDYIKIATDTSAVPVFHILTDLNIASSDSQVLFNSSVSNNYVPGAKDVWDALSDKASQQEVTNAITNAISGKADKSEVPVVPFPSAVLFVDEYPANPGLNHIYVNDWDKTIHVYTQHEDFPILTNYVVTSQLDWNAIPGTNDLVGGRILYSEISGRLKVVNGIPVTPEFPNTLYYDSTTQEAKISIDGTNYISLGGDGVKVSKVATLPVTGDDNTLYVTSGGLASICVSGSMIELSHEIVDLVSSASLDQVPNTYAVSAFFEEKIQDLPEMLIPVTRETVAITGTTMAIDMVGGTQYKLTDPSAYGLETLIINSVGNSGYAAEAMFTFGAVSASVNIPANVEIVGAAEPVFLPAHSYILNIQNNLMVVSEYLPNS